MAVNITIKEVQYKIRHLGNGEILRENPREVNRWVDKVATYKRHIEDERQGIIDRKVSEINRRNRTAEERCKASKSATLNLLIITNIV